MKGRWLPTLIVAGSLLAAITTGRLRIRTAPLLGGGRALDVGVARPNSEAVAPEIRHKGYAADAQGTSAAFNRASRILAARAHANSRTLHRDQGAGELAFVSRQRCHTRRTLLARRKADDPHDAGVMLTSHDRQLTKVLVDGDQDSPRARCRHSAAARSRLSNRRRMCQSLFVRSSGCHCTPKTNASSGDSTASITPSGACADARRSGASSRMP